MYPIDLVKTRMQNQRLRAAKPAAKPVAAEGESDEVVDLEAVAEDEGQADEEIVLDAAAIGAEEDPIAALEALAADTEKKGAKQPPKQ